MPTTTLIPFPDGNEVTGSIPVDALRARYIILPDEKSYSLVKVTLAF
ncbi:hypothetical protein SYNTR_1567 [Candidatus Syntrophocurvum alkaliphilum]|uniref:Uncharacterized protein n=1 Tax=Candidatus Syntrophocurvum alkaliphilum TaxID=2293317 RepID=A0A6I6DIZ3_9FIRM|nr:hypothetical protein [Candidatus Syntrophocurvum alkaliphilum]QGU00161.1 hypothetical protein SYNTR_1567 [Candidatus Syntrophocurvum alkaliphilum]